jgi:hypothetical protein
MDNKALLSITAAAMLVATSAEAVVLCAKPRSDSTYNTSVKIRESCKTGETQLDPAALGLQGPQGVPGTPGVLDFYIRSVSETYSPPSSVQFNFQVYCDPNDKVTGGGVYSTNFTEVEEYYHYPVTTLEGWAVSGLFTGDASVTITLYAVCADLPDPPEE